jgi:hypothetical protein
MALPAIAAVYFSAVISIGSILPHAPGAPTGKGSFCLRLVHAAYADSYPGIHDERLRLEGDGIQKIHGKALVTVVKSTAAYSGRQKFNKIFAVANDQIVHLTGTTFRKPMAHCLHGLIAEDSYSKAPVCIRQTGALLFSAAANERHFKTAPAAIC